MNKRILGPRKRDGRAGKKWVGVVVRANNPAPPRLDPIAVTAIGNWRSSADTFETSVDDQVRGVGAPHKRQCPGEDGDAAS
jgi:hypothetical protein